MIQDTSQRQLYIQNIKSILQYNAVRNPGSTAVKMRAKDGTLTRVSYRKPLNIVNRLGTALLHRGLSDAHVAIVGKNSANWCYAFLSVVSGVGVAVPVDHDMSADSLIHLIRFASVKALFVDRVTYQKLLGFGKKLPKKIQLFSLEEDDDGTLPSVQRLTEEGEAFIDDGDDSFLHRFIDPDALAVLMFTSGTTGNAKAVMLSNSNLCSDIMLVARRVDLNQQDSTLCVLPMHHAYQMICMLLMFYVGGSVSFCPGLRYVSQDLTFFAPSVFVTVPLMLEKMHKKINELIEIINEMKEE